MSIGSLSHELSTNETSLNGMENQIGSRTPLSSSSTITIAPDGLTEKGTNLEKDSDPSGACPSSTSIVTGDMMEKQVDRNNIPGLGSGEISSTGPPPLPFSPYDHKLSTAIFWILVILESCILPIALYYGLWFGTELQHWIVFTIITCVFGIVSGNEYFVRAWKLIRNPARYQPLNGTPSWYNFDFTQWLLFFPYSVMTLILVGGTIPNEPLVRLCSTPAAVFMIIVGFAFCMSYIWTSLGRRLPFRMSSHLKGDIAPPVTYAILEDIIAVDNNCGRSFREALRTRYQASWRFRRLLHRVTLFWGLPSLIFGVLLVILIFLLDPPISYGIGWGVPTVWAMIWTVINVVWVNHELAIERQEWGKDHTDLGRGNEGGNSA